MEGKRERKKERECGTSTATAPAVELCTHSLGCVESQSTMSSPSLTCLRVKWPTLNLGPSIATSIICQVRDRAHRQFTVGAVRDCYCIDIFI